MKEEQMVETSQDLLQSLLNKSNLAMAIVNQTRDIVIIADMNFQLLCGSSSFQSAVGYSAEEIENRSLDMFLTPESVLLIRQVLSEQTDSNGKPGREEDNVRRFVVQMLSRNGDAVSLEMQLSVIRDEKGAARAFFSVAREITEQSRMEESLRFAERKYRDLFESSNDAIMLLDKRSFFDCNKKTLELYGFHSKDEFIKYHPGEVSPFFQPDGEPSVEKANRLIDIAMGKASHTFIWIHKKLDGTLFPAEILLSRFELDGRAVVQAVVRDITERVQSELALKRSKEELEVKSAYLEEANTALKVLLRRREEDKSALEEDVLANVRSLVIPYIERLKQSSSGPEQQAYFQVLEANLNSIISPFLRNVTLAHFNLTGREIEIANLVKEGKTNKEISGMLNLSIRSVEFHRDNIRKKMKLDHRKANLRAFLMSLS